MGGLVRTQHVCVYVCVCVCMRVRVAPRGGEHGQRRGRGPRQRVRREEEFVIPGQVVVYGEHKCALGAAGDALESNTARTQRHLH